jgi:predicted nucleotidyltransferase
MTDLLEKILNPFKEIAVNHRLKHKEGLPVGYTDIKDFLDVFVHELYPALHEITGVVLYGSVARGTANNYSDIDILLITNDRLKSSNGVERCKDNIYGAEFNRLLSNRNLNMYLHEILVTKDELEETREEQFTYNIADDGIILYDRDGSTKELLDKYKLISHKGDRLIP